MTPPHYVTCPNCGVKRDVSGRYTSPANQERDIAGGPRSTSRETVEPRTSRPF